MVIALEVVMGIYVGLFLITLVIGYLAVSFFQTRVAGKGTDEKKAGSPNVRQKPHRSKQKGTIGPGSRSHSTAKAIRRSALIAGAIQKPWGW